MIKLLKWVAPLSLVLSLPLTGCGKNEPVVTEAVSIKTNCSLIEIEECYPYLFDANDPHVHDEILAWFIIYSSWDNGMRAGGEPEFLPVETDILNRFMSKLDSSNPVEMRSKTLVNCFKVFNVEPLIDVNTQEGYDACLAQIESASMLDDWTMQVLKASIDPDSTIEDFEAAISPLAKNGNASALIMMIEVAEEMDEHDEFDWLKKTWRLGNSRAGSYILKYERNQLNEKEAIEIFETIFASINSLPSDNLKSIGLGELMSSLEEIDNLSLKTQVKILSSFKSSFPEFSDVINGTLEELKG